MLAAPRLGNAHSDALGLWSGSPAPLAEDTRNLHTRSLLLSTTACVCISISSTCACLRILERTKNRRKQGRASLDPQAKF